jgi:hypothetical protein
MIRGHPNGNQDLKVDDTIFVEFMQQYDEKVKQKHADGHLCSTVIGSFFQDFVKIFNKIRANVVSELKTCGHTN